MEFHRRIARDSFDQSVSDEEAVLLVIAFHYFAISATRLGDTRGALGSVIYGALHLRHASEAVASIWHDEIDVRAKPSHWQIAWEDCGGYKRSGSLNEGEAEKLRSLVRRIENHPFVGRVRPDRWEHLFHEVFKVAARPHQQV